MDILECYHHLIVSILLELSPEDARRCYYTGIIPKKTTDSGKGKVSPREAVRDVGYGMSTKEVLQKHNMSRTCYYRWKKRIQMVDEEERRQHQWRVERRRIHGQKKSDQVAGQISIFDFDLPPDPSIKKEWLKTI